MGKQGAVRADLLISGAAAVVILGLAIFSFIYYRNQNDDFAALSDISRLRSSLELSFVENTFYPKTFPVGQYAYTPTPDGSDYFIQFELRSNQRYLGLVKGIQCASREGIRSGTCPVIETQP